MQTFRLVISVVYVVFAASSIHADISLSTTISDIEGVGNTHTVSLDYYENKESWGFGTQLKSTDAITLRWRSMGGVLYKKLSKKWIVGADLDYGRSDNDLTDQSNPFAEYGVFASRLFSKKLAMELRAWRIDLDDVSSTLWQTKFTWNRTDFAIEPGVTVSLGDARTRTLDMKVRCLCSRNIFAGVAVGDIAQELTDLAGEDKITRIKQIYTGISFDKVEANLKFSFGLEFGKIGDTNRVALTLALARQK